MTTHDADMAHRCSDVVAFIGDLTWEMVPLDVRRRLAMLTVDASVAARAGARLPASQIITDFVATAMGGDQATCLLTGQRVSAAGAALANGTMMNAVDYDDGHALAKGHPGAVIIPAAMAVAEATGASHEEFLLATLIGYEVGIRAAIAQHERWPLFHSSGTWGSMGAAAAAARLLGLSPAQTDAALGLAEYHAPVDLIMRAVAEPTMAKDAMGWGAHVGVTSAQLAGSGFTAHRSEFVADRLAGLGSTSGPGSDLGETWLVLDTYLKPFPCCRWVHPALAAAEQVLLAAAVTHLNPAEVERIEVRTFAAAAELSRVIPVTSEEAQFNLIWPLAAYLVRGELDLESITTDLGDPDIAAMAARIDIVVDPDFEAGFPAVRRSSLTLTSSAGRTFASGACTAAGDGDDPHWERVVREKFPDLTDARWACFDAEPLSEHVPEVIAHDLLGALTFPIRTPA